LVPIVSAGKAIMRNALFFAAAACGVLANGCTHAQLRRSTVNQVGSVADIYQQQVLNNLAKFVHDSNSLPDFGVPTSGVATVSDTGGATNGLEWSNTSLIGATLGFNANRNVNQNWALKPVQDPRKLELMRCAYQQAVGKVDCSECCPDCRKRFANFYTGDPCGTVPMPCQACPEKDQCKVFPEGTEERKNCDACVKSMKADTGIVTTECLGSCWFHIGCADCISKVKKRNPCCLIGEHCGTVVWVAPGRGTDELAKLTIAILDFAVNDPKEAKEAKEPTRIVTGYFDRAGNPSTQLQASYHIVANLAFPDSNEPFNSLETATSLQSTLLGPPVDSTHLRPLPSTEGGAATHEPTSGPTRADVQLELKALPQSTFLPN
jgi:hypothetical protein